MLLRTGLILATFSVLLAAGVALLVNLRAEVAETPGAWAKPSSSQTTTQEAPDTGERLEISEDEAAGGASDGPRKETPEPPLEIPSSGSSPAAPSEGGASGSSGERSTPGEVETGLLPVSSANWPIPSRGELSQISRPRYFDPNPDAVMSLTIEALGLYDVPVFDSFGEESLDRGVMHVPDTAYPWEEAEQQNVFLAGHRVGLPGTDGRLLFFALDQLREGDMIFLEDRAGNAYAYQVSEMFRVEPYDAWVADTLVGRDMLTLQTCTYPTFEDRLIVRADRV